MNSQLKALNEAVATLQSILTTLADKHATTTRLLADKHATTRLEEGRLASRVAESLKKNDELMKANETILENINKAKKQFETWRIEQLKIVETDRNQLKKAQDRLEQDKNQLLRQTQAHDKTVSEQSRTIDARISVVEAKEIQVVRDIEALENREKTLKDDRAKISKANLSIIDYESRLKSRERALVDAEADIATKQKTIETKLQTIKDSEQHLSSQVKKAILDQTAVTAKSEEANRQIARAKNNLAWAHKMHEELKIKEIQLKDKTAIMASREV